MGDEFYFPNTIVGPHNKNKMFMLDDYNESLRKRKADSHLVIHHATLMLVEILSFPSKRVPALFVDFVQADGTNIKGIIAKASSSPSLYETDENSGEWAENSELLEVLEGQELVQFSLLSRAGLLMERSVRLEKKIGENKGKSYENMTVIVQNYVDGLIAKYPYWNRTLGADHFFVTCHDVGVRAFEGSPLLIKNTIRVVCSPSYNVGFIPHKDVALSQVLQPFAFPAGGNDVENRTTLGFWAGHRNSRYG